MKTLEELETIAGRASEAREDEWVAALADREEVDFSELRPHLASVSYDEGYRTRLVFAIPGHIPIVLESDYMDYAEASLARLEHGELVGKYRWRADGHRTSPPTLGQALLVSRRAYEVECASREGG